jgi:hypothetical protein
MDKKKIISLVLIVGGALLILVIAGANLARKGGAGVASYSGSLSDSGMALPAGRSNRVAISMMAPEATSLDAGSKGVSGEAISENVQPEKKEIKNGNLNLRVDKIDDAMAEMKDVAKSNGGEIFSSSIFTNSKTNIKQGNVSVRVPVANFEKTFGELKKVAALVLQESTSGQDVTEAYADLQARLKNKEAEEISIAKILERTGTIEDVLKVTRELNRVRGEIEMLKGQIKMMNSQTDFSLIHVQMTEDPEVTVTSSWRPLQIAKDAVNSLLSDFQRFVGFAIVLVINVIPIILLYLLLLWVIYLIGRKIYLKIKARKEGIQ